MIWLERLWQDVRHGYRLFAKNPGFTAVAVISIAFGTGANVAMFSAADALLLRPLPVVRPSELVTVGSRTKRGLGTVSIASYPDYVDIRDASKSFDGLVAFTSRTAGFVLHPGAPAQVKMTTIVSGNFFRVLGVEPVLGRGFLPEDDRVPGRDAVTVLSYGLWQQELGGDTSVLGRKIRIAGIEFTIVGIAPERFTGVEPRFIRQAAYVPLAMWPLLLNSPDTNPLTARGLRVLTVKGRLSRPATLASARAELAAIGKDLERAYPETNANQAITAVTEFAAKFDRYPLDSSMLVVLTTLSVAVLCVACANVAGLLASRAPVRAREIALRLAIGAGRARLVRQLITETLAIAVAGGLGGLAVGYAGIVMLRQIEIPTDVVAVPPMELDERALFFSLAAAMASAVVFGLGPAIQTTRVDLAGALKSTDAATKRRQRLTGRSTLVAVQVALSLLLLTIAVGSYRLFRHELLAGPGFRTTRVAKLTIDTSQARYSLPQSVRFFERVIDDARGVPRVTSVTVTSAMPLISYEPVPIVPEGYRLPEDQTAVRVLGNSIDEGYFETMDIAVVAGRAFRATDAPGAPLVSIVNETLARHFWPEADLSTAVGKRFRLNDERGPWVEIVGVARTTKYGYIAEPPQDAAYFPFRQQPRGNMVLVAQTERESSEVLAPLRDIVRRMDAGVPVYDIQTMEAFYAARATSLGSIITRLIGGMGVMGMTLTMVGLYGLVSYAAGRRTREIGIRIAIGAGRARVVRMILSQGMTPAWIGLAIGLPLSAATARLLPSLVPIEHGFDADTLLLVVPLLCAVTVLAALVPANRAARVDPTVALRCE